jgi:multidrug resistance protein
MVRTISSTSRKDTTNEADIDKELDLEKADNSDDISEEPSPRTSQDDHQTPVIDQHAGKTVVSFSRNDPLNPYCWPLSKKIYVTIVGIVLVLNSTIGSSLASGATSQTAEQFGITNQAQLVLPTSIYLIGYVLAPLVFSPLSEQYGRKIVMISTFILYTAFSLGCALAPSWSGLIIMRLLTGVGASTPISVTGGIYADMFSDPKARGRVMVIFMGATTWGPVWGPLAGGYIAVVSWRWVYWLQLILAGVTWPLVLLMPETYGPVVLKRKAEKMRKEGNANAFAPSELEKQDMRQLFVVVLTRPIRMFLFEMIVLCSCLYIALVYAIFYSTSLTNANTAHNSPADAIHSVPPSLPHHLHRRLRLQRRRTRTSLPRRRRRQYGGLRYRPPLGRLPRSNWQKNPTTSLVPQRGISQSPARLSRSPIPQRLDVLARLDGALVDPLDRPSPGRHTVRNRIPTHFSGPHQLPCRRLRDLLCERRRRGFLFAQLVRCSVAFCY